MHKSKRNPPRSPPGTSTSRRLHNGNVKKLNGSRSRIDLQSFISHKDSSNHGNLHDEKCDLGSVWPSSPYISPEDTSMIVPDINSQLEEGDFIPIEASKRNNDALSGMKHYERQRGLPFNQINIQSN